MYASNVQHNSKSKQHMIFQTEVYGWLSKLWSLFGYPNFNWDPKRDNNSHNQPYVFGRRVTVPSLRFRVAWLGSTVESLGLGNLRARRATGLLRGLGCSMLRPFPSSATKSYLTTLLATSSIDHKYRVSARFVLF